MGEGSEREQCHLLSSRPACSHFPQANCALSGADSHMGGFVYVLWPNGPLQQTLLWDWEFSPATAIPTDFHSQRLSLKLPMLKPWVLPSVLYPVCSSQLIHAQMWDGPVSQPLLHPHSLPSCQAPSLPCCPSPPLLPVWMNVSSLSPWLSDFHTSSITRNTSSISCQFWLGFFCLFLNYLLSSFWLCEEAQCVYLCLHLGQKLTSLYRKILVK